MGEGGLDGLFGHPYPKLALQRSNDKLGFSLLAGNEQGLDHFLFLFHRLSRKRVQGVNNKDVIRGKRMFTSRPWHSAIFFSVLNTPEIVSLGGANIVRWVLRKA